MQEIYILMSEATYALRSRLWRMCDVFDTWCLIADLI